MSDDGKELSAPRLGLRSFIAAKKSQSEQLDRPSQWSPGVRALSAEEYDRFTDQLARELLATCTSEHIAVIAAQHMIYADELQCVLAENQTEPVNVVEIVSKIATKVATEVSMTTLEAQRKHLAEKRAKAVRDLKKDVMDLARSIAAKKWHEDTEQKIKIGEMAKMVYRALLDTEYRKLVSSPDAVQRWIRPVAPDYAKKRGR
ncbi:hypothetical protein ACMC9K_20655 [Pseudomonadota bacterium DY0742]